MVLHKELQVCDCNMLVKLVDVSNLEVKNGTVNQIMEFCKTNLSYRNSFVRKICIKPADTDENSPLSKNAYLEIKVKVRN